MGPQQRILLETVYEALEAGGHTFESWRGSDTAVYAGTMTADYNDALTRDHNTMPNYFTGTNRAIISNRVSYFFDWHGASMTIFASLPDVVEDEMKEQKKMRGEFIA